MTTLVRVLKEAEEQAERPHPSISGCLILAQQFPLNTGCQTHTSSFEKKNLKINSKTVKQPAEGGQDEDRYRNAC